MKSKNTHIPIMSSEVTALASTDFKKRIYSCILHIGTEKTGSTALQNWLYHNRSELSIRGIYLSDKVGKPNNRVFTSYFSRRVDDWAHANRLNSVDEKKIYLRNFESSLRQEFKEAFKAHDRVVISSEHLHSRITSSEEVLEIHDFLMSIFDKVYVLCYFRNQADMALSLYSTALKFGHAVTLDDFMVNVHENNYYYNFENIADNWSDAFGRENCIFKVFKRSQMIGNDIRYDFLDVCGICTNHEDFDFQQRNPNESLSVASASAFRALNFILPSLPDKHNLARRSTRLANKVLKRAAHKSLSSVNKKLRLSNREEVNNRFASSNARFFAKYFDGVDHFK